MTELNESVHEGAMEDRDFVSHPRLLAVGARLAGVAVAGALLGAAVHSLSGAKPAVVTPPPPVQQPTPVDGPQLRTPVGPRGLEAIRRSHDVVTAERQRLLGQGATSVVVAFYNTGDASRGLFGLEAIRAPRASVAARRFHDHTQYVGTDYAWMAGVTWQTFSVAGEAYQCIASATAKGELAAAGLCEFRDGDVQGTGSSFGFSLPQLLAMTVEERLQIERRD